MKYRWLFCPTQLATKGQWWSNRITHLPHVSQCFVRGACKRDKQAQQAETPYMGWERFFLQVTALL